MKAARTAPTIRPDMTEPLLSVQNLQKRFATMALPAVRNVSLHVDAGEILALIGPSGCGKSTTLRMIAGLETADTGRILLAGRDVSALPTEARGIGMVFQDYALFPHMDVARNILFGAKNPQPQTLAALLEMVGLSGLGDRYPDQLSGGQQQRVALARSFAARPRMILLDEPFSNLDPTLRAATRREIRRMLKSSGLGVIVVTHDQEEALSFADRVAVMHEGEIQQIGSAEQVYDRPVNAFVAGFLGRTNLIEGIADGSTCALPFGRIPLSETATGLVTLSVRPENLLLSPLADSAPGADTGRVSAFEFKGHDLTYWVDVQGTELQADVMAGARLPVGATVRIEIRGPAVVLQKPA